jgi:hypothetical protein
MDTGRTLADLFLLVVKIGTEGEGAATSFIMMQCASSQGRAEAGSQAMV